MHSAEVQQHTAREYAGFSEADVLTLLQQHTYEQVSAQTGWSRGRIYSAAVKHNARKQEGRIQMRQRDREAMRLEFAREVAGKTTKADVLDFLVGLPKDYANLVLTSPPYNLGKAYAGSDIDAWKFSYFEGWLTMVLSECERILKPGGTLCLQLGQTVDWTGTLYPMDVMVFETLRRTGLSYQSRIIWSFGHGLTPKRRLSERYETLLVLSKGPQQTFNANAARTPAKEPQKRAYRGPRRGELSGHPMGAWQSNTWYIPSVASNHPEKVPTHPCQFPMELARRAVMLYTNAGDLVVDPFSGSGTTHATCIETGREFAGCDLFYEDERRERLANVHPSLVTLLPGVSDESAAIWAAEARPVYEPARTHSEQAELALFEMATR